VNKHAFRLLPLAALALATLGFTNAARATDTVTWSPLTTIVQGSEPFTYGPQNLTITPPNLGTSVTSLSLTITVSNTNPTTGNSSVPNGVTTALNFFTLNNGSSTGLGATTQTLTEINPSTYTITCSYSPSGPTKAIYLNYTLNFPMGNFAGNYGYFITVTTGLPATDNLGNSVSSGFGTINATVSPPTPTISINLPANNAIFTIPAGSSSNTYQVPYDIEGTTVAGSTLTQAGATLYSGSSTSGPVVSGFSPTFYGFGTGAITTNIGTAGTNATVGLGPGTYTMSATDTNNYGGVGITTSASLVTFTVQGTIPPAIVISVPANGQVFSASSGSGTAAVPYTITGATTNGLITLATASMVMNGTTPVVGFTGLFTGLGSAGVSDSGTINLQPGTYTINASDTSISGLITIGTANATPVTFTVIGAPTVAISIPATLFEVSAGTGTVTVPYTITGATPTGSTFTGPSSAAGGFVLTSATGTPAGSSGFTSVFTVGSSATTISASGSVTLTPGTYSINASDINNLGGTASAAVSFTVVGLPTVVINTPASGAVYEVGSSGTAAVPYTITGNTAAGTTFSSTSMTSSLSSSTGASTSSYTPVYTVGSGGTTITATGTATLGVGSYSIAASVTNNLGGAATATPVSFTVIGLPTISITSPSNGSVYSAGASGTATVSYAIAGSTPAGTLLSTAGSTLTDNGAAVTTFLPTISGLTTAASTASSGALSLSPGSYVLTATETNNLGATATATQVAFTVVGAPTVTISSPAANQVYSVSMTTGTAAVPYTISGNTPAGTLLASASGSIASNGTAVLTLTSANFPNVPPATAGTSTTVSGTLNLGPGTYTVNAADTNNSGGSATAAQVVFTVVGPPAISITAPANGSTIYIPSGSTTASVNYTVAGSTPSGTTFASAASATASMTDSSGNAVGAFGASFAVGTGSTSITATGAVSLAAGTYTINASDVNNVGGTATATPVTFTVATSTTPTVTIVTPTPGQVVYIASGATTAPVSYQVTGATPTGSTFTSASSGSATIAVATGASGSVAGVTQPVFTGYGASSTAITSSGTVNLPAGTYTIVASDVNNTGGTASAGPNTFTVVAPVVPTIAITGPTNGQSFAIASGSTTAAVPYVISGATPTGTTFPTAASATATLTSSTGGSTTGFVPVFAVGSPATTISTTGTVNLAAGTYTINATDTNSAGGSATASPVTFTVTGGACSAPTVTTTGKFTGSVSCANNKIWFNSTVNVSGVPSSGAVLQFSNSTVSFAVNGSTVSLVAPSAVITFSATATQATSTYNATTNSWATTVPAGYTGNVFLTALSYAAPSNFSPGSEAITWAGSFLGSAQNMSLQWTFTADALTQCSTNYNSCGVKPVESGSYCQYNNSDRAGTCEGYKSYSCGAPCGSNGTGSNVSTVSISGLYTTGVTDSGALLAAGTNDAHWVITGDSAPNPNAYLGVTYVDPTSLAGGWVPNTSNAQWVTAPGGVNCGNGAGNNALPASGGSGVNIYYFYTLTFNMPANVNLSTATITGTIAADDAAQSVFNWTTVPSGAGQPSGATYTKTANFTLNSSNATFVAGANTITFAVFNENPGPDPSGLLVTALSGTVQVPCTPVSVTYCPTAGQTGQGAGSPPAVTVTSPTEGATYTIAAGSSATVPVGFSAVSPTGSGNITAISATLNGATLPLTTTSGVNSATTATGAATLTLSTAGTYNLVYTGTNTYGSSTANTSFTIVVVQPPTVNVTVPANGATITIPYGSTTASVAYSLVGATPTGSVTSVNVTLNGAALATAPTISGLNSASITGSGTLKLGAGSYSLTATDSNGVASATDTNTFTVVAGDCGGGYVSGTGVNNEKLVWIQQSSCSGTYGYNNGCNQSVTGGAIVPIAFSVFSNLSGQGNCWGSTGSGTFVKDTSVVIAIYAIYSNNTSSSPTLYTYSATGPNPPYYSISGNQYLLEFPTQAGVNHYQVEVYTSGNSLQLLGCEDLYTSGNCMPSACNIITNVNKCTVAAGNTIWFNSCVSVAGLSNHASTLWFDASNITFTGCTGQVTLTAPSACIKFDPNCSVATTTYNAASNCWVTDVPLGYGGNVFLCAVPYTCTSSFTSQGSVNWTGCFRSDTGSVYAQWQCSASAYSQCSSDWNAEGVKAIDSASYCQYNNWDSAGTHESYKNCISNTKAGTGGNFVGYVSPSISANGWLDSSWINSGWGWWW